MARVKKTDESTAPAAKAAAVPPPIQGGALAPAPVAAPPNFGATAPAAVAPSFGPPLPPVAPPMTAVAPPVPAPATVSKQDVMTGMAAQAAPPPPTETGPMLQLLQKMDAFAEMQKHILDGIGMIMTTLQEVGTAEGTHASAAADLLAAILAKQDVLPGTNFGVIDIPEVVDQIMKQAITGIHQPTPLTTVMQAWKNFFQGEMQKMGQNILITEEMLSADLRRYCHIDGQGMVHPAAPQLNTLVQQAPTPQQPGYAPYTHK